MGVPWPWLGALLAALGLLVPAQTASDLAHPRPRSTTSSRRTEHVCRTIDIRNQVAHFAALENCTVIEGSLSILLIDYADTSAYQNLRFPQLREITDYLLLYRAFGLQTLSHIFPNLAVIRGQRLFYNYALVAFEMPHLEDIGLASLTHIVRGAVRLEKNSKLCYIDTLDWSKIARSVSFEDHFIMENKDRDECPNVCPDKGKFCLGKRDKLCWNRNYCQIVCKGCEDRPCYIDQNGGTKCCHEQCIGGCTGPSPLHCIACKNVFFQGRCQAKCPPGTYMYRNRRCITGKECRSLDQDSRGFMNSMLNWKLHDDRCIPQCPHGFIEGEDKHLCKRCDGPCPKICNSPPIVDNIAGAQRLKDCTEIRGILEIQIRGGNRVGQELEENLGLIEVVTHFIHIVRSAALLSLHFLKNLRLIQGQSLVNERYALFVLDNQNLQDIWNFKSHPNLTLGQGTVFFHQNRKLCLHKIQELVRFANIQDRVDDRDISQSTNGDQVACNISTLKLEVINSKTTYAVVRWTNFHLNDPRELLNFVVYHREAPERNITIFDARDACGTDVWKAIDVRSDDDPKAKKIVEVIYGLEPYKQYAVYVQTYTISTANQGAMSSIVYFLTSPDVPTHPRDIKVVATVQNQLLVTWKEPSRPNGEVTHYVVYWGPQKLSQEKLDQRDYCHDKLHFSGPKANKESVEKEDKNMTQNGECCTCPKSKKEEQQEEEERMFQIEFENYLHDSVYVKRPFPSTTRSPQTFENDPFKDGLRKRRSARTNKSHGSIYSNLPNATNYGLLALGNSSMIGLNDTEDEDDLEAYMGAMVYHKTEILLANLKHFTEYSIEVIACHEYEEAQDIKRCSNRAITTARTLPSEIADNLDPNNVTVHNDSSGDVLIKWPDPTSPNGLIVTYEIKYHKAGSSNLQNIHCLPHKEYRKLGGYKIPGDQLVAGNYSFSIRATSLAGNGSWTEPRFFYVPDKVANTGALKTEVVVGVAVSMAIILIACVACCVWFVAKKRFNQGPPDGILYASVNPEYMSAGDVYVPDEWEVLREKIEIKRELGQGSFGMVYEGLAKNITADEEEIKVAVKTVNENASLRDRIEFLNEASVMKAFTCNHVVKLIGVVSKGQPTLVIMELMANGDLKNFLRMHRPDVEDNNGRKPPTLKQILQWAGEIADGMAYLAAKKFVHRDLAARNCMVSENLVVKIGDFGMTRDIYETDYYRKGGKGLLPVRWMAPESLKDGIFTSQSEVWSFGVVLWEMATLAAQPYQGLANEQVLQYVIDANIMEQPNGCPERLYELMLLCWRHNPKHRPTFCEIVESLVPELDLSFKEASYFFSEENQRDIENSHGPKDPELGAVSDMEPEDMGDDSRTPLTGSPCMGSRLGSLSDISLDQKLRGVVTENLDDSCSTCSHDHSCQCIDVQEDNKVKRRTRGAGSSAAAGRNAALPRPQSTNASLAGGESRPPGSSNEGSKESSKSSGSSHFRMNGIANGHIPRAHMQRFAEC